MKTIQLEKTRLFSYLKITTVDRIDSDWQTNGKTQAVGSAAITLLIQNKELMMHATGSDDSNE